MTVKEPYLIWKEQEPQSAQGPRALPWPAILRIVRWCSAILLLLLVFPPIPVIIPLVWIIAMLSGYGAAVLMGVLMLLPLRRVVFSNWGRISVPSHERLALWCLGLSAVHAAILIISDPVMIEYLKWHQPRHMIAGNAGFVLLALLVITSLERVRVAMFGVRLRFRPIHVVASLVLVVLTAAHMLGSAIYLEGRMKFAALAMICAGLAALALRRPLAPEDTDSTPQ